jgi:hypothetical protein
MKIYKSIFFRRFKRLLGGVSLLAKPQVMGFIRLYPQHSPVSFVVSGMQARQCSQTRLLHAADFATG